MQRAPSYKYCVTSPNKFYKGYCPVSHGEQGWHSGESTHLPPMWPRFDSRSRRHMWVEFIVGSHPCPKGFPPGTLVFLPPQNQHFQIPIRPGNSGVRATPWIPLKFLFIYFYLFPCCIINN